jgi:hypothetical protein
MCGDVLEIWLPLLVPRHPVTIVPDREIMLSMLSPSGDGDRLRVRVDAVLDEFRDGLQGIALRQRNDAYGVPIIPDLQPAPIGIPAAARGLILRNTPARPTGCRPVRTLFVAHSGDDSRAPFAPGKSGVVAVPLSPAATALPLRFPFVALQVQDLCAGPEKCTHAEVCAML